MQQTLVETHWPHKYTLKLCSVTKKYTLGVTCIKNQRSRQNSKNATKSKTNMVSAPVELTACCRKQISIKYLTPQKKFLKKLCFSFSIYFTSCCQINIPVTLRKLFSDLLLPLDKVQNSWWHCHAERYRDLIFESVQ